MKESEIEKYFVWTVERLGGQSYKFRSMTQRGVADRVACLPNGDTWFVELKTTGGRLSALQKFFLQTMQHLNQKHTVLWTKEQIDEWASELQLKEKNHV
jgi:hypothetical protein